MEVITLDLPRRAAPVLSLRQLTTPAAAQAGAIRGSSKEEPRDPEIRMYGFILQAQMKSRTDA